MVEVCMFFCKYMKALKHACFMVETCAFMYLLTEIHASSMYLVLTYPLNDVMVHHIVGSSLYTQFRRTRF